MNTPPYFKTFTIFFVFLLCNNILFAQSNFTESNNPPVSPKWVFEPWVWEDSQNNKNSTRDMITNYKSLGIPVGAVIIDSPWEWPSDPSSADRGYNTFLFEPSRYSTPKSFIDSLNDEGIHVQLWITGVMTTNSPLYQICCDSNYFVKEITEGGDTNNCPTTSFWKGNGIASHIDFFNPSALVFWQGLMDRVFDSLEVDGWKVDQSDARIIFLNKILTYQGEKTKDEYAQKYYTEIYNYTVSRRNNLGMISARPYCKQDDGLGSYWYASKNINTAGWVGDQKHTWAGLNLALENIFVSADSGYSVVGSDIGGYLNNGFTRDSSLFKRWLQMGALMPLMENGGQVDNIHFPWMYSSEVETIYKYYATLHHELVPYLYSYNIAANHSGVPIVQPIGDGSEFNISNWEGDWRYFFGRDLFCAAISTVGTSKQITFPDSDKWIDYWDDDISFNSNENETLPYSYEQYPIFIRSGAIIPMNVENNITGHGTIGSANRLTVLVYPRDTTTFNFHKSIDESILIENFENPEWDSIKISQSTEKFIFRIKLSYNPYSIKMNENYYISEVDDSTEFDSSEEGWRYDASKKYCWIKFSSNGLETSLKISKNYFINIHPSNYETGILAVGEKYYIDRNYVIESVPSEYQFLPMIKTANDDKDSIGLNFQFELNKTSKVYIAYDPRLATPAWISNEYSFTGKSIGVSDTGPDSLIVWEKLFEPGLVILGDNEATTSDASMYFVFCKETPMVKLSCKIFLQGPFEDHKMLTSLSENNYIPLAQPFYKEPWKYEGNESVVEIPTNVVDWILIELRNKNNNTFVESRRAGFILSDGSIVDTNASSPVQFLVEADNYYIVLKHRNHLSVMSAEPVELNK